MGLVMSLVQGVKIGGRREKKGGREDEEGVKEFQGQL